MFSVVGPRHLETVVHTCNEEILLTTGRRMPLDTPRTPSDISLDERYQRLPSVKNTNAIIVAVRDFKSRDVDQHHGDSKEKLRTFRRL